MFKVVNKIISYLSRPGILEGLVSEFLWWLVFGVVSTAYLSATNRLYPILYKYIGNRVVNIIRFVINTITRPAFRIVLLLLLLVLININQNDLLLSIATFFVAVSFFWRPKIQLAFDPIPTFTDDFQKKRNLINWETKTGSPNIEDNFGKPAPDLRLNTEPGKATNSFVILEKHRTMRGSIECDVYLDSNAVFNLVVLCDKENNKWYMARLESRTAFSDGILIKDKGPWREFSMSGTRTKPKKWHRLRVEFNTKKITMFRNGTLIAELKNPDPFGDTIGMFNECSDVHIDNFSLIKEHE